MPLWNQTERRWLDGKDRYLFTNGEVDWMIFCAFVFGAIIGGFAVHIFG